MKLKLYIFLALALLTTSANADDRQTKQGFLENKGQVTDQYHHSRSDIDFVLHSTDLNLFVGSGALHYQFAKAVKQKKTDPGLPPEVGNVPVEMYRIDVELVGANSSVRGIAEEVQPYNERYYTETGGIGWLAHSCKRIVYKNIYPGIDWVIHTKDGAVKYDFVVKEGADPSVIKLKYTGASSLEINSKGGFTAKSSLGSITEAKPYSYTSDGTQVASSFVLNGDELSYRIGSYNGTLTIDPAVAWGTYYGDIGTDEVRGVTNDALGYAYIVGSTGSASNIATTGAHQQTLVIGANDAFMAKIDPSGNRVWGTYYGGIGSESFTSITIDNNNNLYVGGNTTSASGMATPGTHQPALVGGSDALLVKFDTTGARIWGTYYGGNNGENIRQVVCDNSGNVLICGNTLSTTGIATLGSHQPALAQGSDAYVAKFNSAGIRQWGTYYGGAATESGIGICTDNSGNVYLGGVTNSDDGIATPGSHQPVKSTSEDVYLVKFNASGIRQWGTYYGGEHSYGETGGYIAHDGSGNIFLAGFTASTTNISTPGSFQPVTTGAEGFIVKFDGAGVRQWGSYYGGFLYNEVLSGMTCDNGGNVFVCGNGTGMYYFPTVCAPQVQNGGLTDAIIGKVKGDGTEVLWSTFIAGTANDYVYAISYDGLGNLYVAGSAYSANNIGTANVHQPLLSGGADGYLVKFIDCAIPGVAYGVVGNTPVCEGDTVLYTVGQMCGASAYIWDVPNDWYGYSTADTFLAVVGSSGSINVYATTGCGASSPQSLTVTVFAAPEPVVTQGVNIVYTTTNYVTYQWYHNGILLPGATFPFYDHTQTPPGGYFTVTVTDSNGCKGTSLPFTLGIDEISVKGLHVYPNPVRDEIFVTGHKEDMGYEVRDVVGSKLQEGVLKANDGRILLGDIPGGIYILKIGGQSLKLLKE